VIDPRWIRPLDEEIILNSIAKTHHPVVADTAGRPTASRPVWRLAAEGLLGPRRQSSGSRCRTRQPRRKPLRTLPPDADVDRLACHDVLRSEVQVYSTHRRAGEAFAGPY
jgi:hypothetical protein